MGIHYSLMHFDLIQVPKIWCRMTWGWCLLILIKAKGTRLFFSTQPQFSCTDRVREKHNGWTLSDCQHHHLRHAVTKPLLQNDDVCIKLQEVTSSKRSPWTWPYAGLVSSTDGQAGKLGGGAEAPRSVKTRPHQRVKVKFIVLRYSHQKVFWFNCLELQENYVDKLARRRWRKNCLIWHETETVWFVNFNLLVLTSIACCSSSIFL